MSHLLHLNSCDNYPNKCPHICLHLLVKQHPNRQGSNIQRGQASSGRRIIPINISMATINSDLCRLFSSAITQQQVIFKLLSLLKIWKRRNVVQWSPWSEGGGTIRIALWMSKNFRRKARGYEFLSIQHTSPAPKSPRISDISSCPAWPDRSVRRPPALGENKQLPPHYLPDPKSGC